MNEIELNEFRIGRLDAAVEQVSKGNKTDFGRRLGYKDGAFVRQMLTGIRPVTEKTIRAIEAMPGMKGWFEVNDDSAPIIEAQARPHWPFHSISEAEVHALPPSQLVALEGALALAIAQLKLGINVSLPSPPPPTRTLSPARGSLVDLNDGDDPFPMRIQGLPAAPWEGGKTTYQAERDPKVRISTQTGVVANVGPGEPHAANDKFDKVPEMADVRLAAGDGIENHLEEQTGVIHFRRSFLRSVGADTGKARVVYAKGDSMEPVIRDGAALLVVPNENLTVRDLAAGGVYAINYDGKMIVKTVTRDRLTSQWVARSFNPAYPDIPLENGTPVRVLGQVVWAGSRLRDDAAGQWARV
ncbi:S24 family peptidase [Achromobacter denitrificans]|uniref:S24 family peptidase n=1 Tax=Achromobacter denitrificans TaxID=32002 RepID=UPI0023E7C498|nr:S24 family peptidase [Achromobacter denitrificans]MDF3851378.1 S24 family peptidase [Achromobacter denitrificans]